MPLPKKLTCDQVFKVASEFFSGVSVKQIAIHFEVSRLTVTRIIDRKTYKDCIKLNNMVTALGKATYLERVDQQMESNKRIGRGNKKEVS